MAIDFHFDEQQKLIRDSAREFFRKHCPPAAVRAAAKATEDFPAELWAGMADMGWLGITVAEEFGGLGASFLDLYVLYPEMGRFLVPAPHLDAVVVGAGLVSALGSVEQKQAILREVVAGKLLIAPALTDTGGFGAEDITTEARGANGGYVLNGTKLLVMAAGAANLLVVAARIAGAEGVSLFLIDAAAPGVAREKLPNIAGYPLYAVTFTDVSVGAEGLLGEAGGAWPALEAVLDKAAVLQAAMVAGAGERVLEIAVDYAKNRVQFGTPIGKHQAVQYLCTDVAVAQRHTALLALHAAWRIDRGLPVAREASLAKAMAAKAAAVMTFSAHEVHAGIGFMEDYDLSMYTRRAKHWESHLGDRRHHLERAIALTLEPAA